MDINHTTIEKIIYSFLINQHGKQITPSLCEHLSEEICETLIDFINKTLEN
jgi:hypothetical protein